MENRSTIKPIINTRDLSIGYSDKLIASKIDVEICSGQLSAVIGINGAGKSTFLQTLTGELPPKLGTIFLNKKPLSAYTAKSISEEISVVFTNPFFSNNLSVFEAVALGRHPYTNWLGSLANRDKKEVLKALKAVRIYSLANRKCVALSDGQLQKVFIARALAQNTKIVLLDEPTNHLDLYHKAFVLKLLKTLTRQTHKAIVFATHEINLALQLCDQILLVNEGEIKQYNTTELINSGKLTTLFPKELITFDEKNGIFKLS